MGIFFILWEKVVTYYLTPSLYSQYVILKLMNNIENYELENHKNNKMFFSYMLYQIKSIYLPISEHQSNCKKR